MNHNDESCDFTLGPVEEVLKDIQDDGTGTKVKERKPIKFSNEFDLNDKQFRQAQLTIREDELIALMDQMRLKTFLSKDVGLVTKQASLDFDKLVLWGQGFGGMAAISTGIQDDRVKAVIGLNPWMFPHQRTITDKKYGIQKKDSCSLQVISTEKWPTEIDKLMKHESSQQESVQQFINNSSAFKSITQNINLEYIVTKEMNNLN